MRKLTYKYPNHDKPVLKNINLDIKIGEKIAIVGDNGAGKSTFIKCITGLYEAKEGDIFFDDTNQRDINKIKLRSAFSVLFQDFIKYELSIKENIGFGDIESITDLERLNFVIQKSGISSFMDKMENGLDTILGTSFDNGVDLSGGQWQKIAISRSLFRNSKIVVFDEPTSALDPISELDIFLNFIKLSEGKTTIVITHRLGICRLVDRIILMRDGEIIEEGDHESLMKRDGEYKKMFDIQSEWYKGEKNLFKEVTLVE